MERARAHGWRTRDAQARLGDVALAIERELKTTFNRLSCCILAGRLMHELLVEDGFAVDMLPCRVAVWNGVWIRYVAEHGRPPATLAESESLANEGGWCSAMGAGYLDDRDAPFGFDPRRGAYNGHVVAIVDGRWLVDPTLGQTSEPDRGIATGPLVTEIPGPGFVRGESVLANLFAWGGNDPVHVTYEAVAADRSYRDAPIWNAPEARWVKRRVLAELAAG